MVAGTTDTLRLLHWGKLGWSECIRKCRLRPSNRRLQLTAFGARDRAVFGAFCAARLVGS